ncbi:MAG: hypothetical protein ACRC43_08580, partial [Plesiomonas shigelloides]
LERISVRQNRTAVTAAVVLVITITITTAMLLTHSTLVAMRHKVKRTAVVVVMPSVHSRKLA